MFQLLDRESSYVPVAVGDYGSAWHLHQGWFTTLENPIASRILQKVHFDALSKNEVGSPTVKMDTLLRSDFGGRIPAQQLFEDNSALENVFVAMHDQNKKLLSDLLTTPICRNIGLEVDA